MEYARNAITLGLAAEEYGSRFFSQGTSTSGVIEHPGKLTPEAYQRLRESWNAKHSGLHGAHSTPILEEGAKFSDMGIKNEDAQFLQTRKFQVEEVARMYRVPLHKIGSLERATFNNIEEQSLEFVTDCIRPWCVRIEQEFNRKLLTAQERQQGYFFEFLIDGLLRGNMKARYESYAIGRSWGWLSPDDVRDMENLNKLEGGQGDIYLVPANMIDAETLTQPEDDQEQDDATDDLDEEDIGQADRSAAIAESSALVLGDALGRMHRKEAEALKRAAPKGELSQFCDEFYGKHEKQLAEALAPGLLAQANSMAAVRNLDKNKAAEIAVFYGEVLARKLASSRQAAVKGNKGDIESLLAEWQAETPKVAQEAATTWR